MARQIYTIPISAGVPSQLLSISLNDVAYNIAFRWNSRGEFWSMDIRDENNVLILGGVSLKTGLDLLSPFNLGIGEIYSVDVTNSGLEMTLDNAGIETQIVYLTPEDDDGEAV